MKINNMELAEFFKELSKPIKLKEREDGSSYFPVDEVRKRVDELLLPSNYNFSCTKPELYKIASSASFVLVGKLEVKDDEGNIVLVREVPGGVDVKFSKNDPEKPANELKSLISSAESSAFVNAWRAAGLASSIELKYKQGRKSETELKPYDVVFTSNLSVKGEIVMAEATINGEQVAFRIFKEGLNYFENNNKAGRVLSRQEVLKCLIENYGVSKQRQSIQCVGTFNDYNGQRQFIFKRGVN